MKTKGIKAMGILLVVALIVGMMGTVAFASTSVAVYTGYRNGANTYLGSYTAAQLNAMPISSPSVKRYSSYDCNNYVLTSRDAYGPDLEYVLRDAYGSNFDSVTNIEFYASADGWDKTVSKDSVLYAKYFASDTDPGTYVTPIIATKYGSTGGTLSSNGCLRNFFGQQTYDEDVMQYWTKNLDAIYLQ
ncbi:MAG: hypothetical protein A4E56_00483 [Pelotomaculum sp. PtaU1.Bin065]|nr:MAG: hypothetical protein A4E56_00483 [Pelotomaculum sp. PtaU1.Bin065]